MCFSIRIQDLCSHQPLPHLLKKELMEHLCGSLPGTTSPGPASHLSLMVPVFPGNNPRDAGFPEEAGRARGEALCAHRSAAPSGNQGQRSRTAQPPHTGQPRGVSGCCRPEPRQTLPAAHCRQIYRSRARGSRCLPEGGAGDTNPPSSARGAAAPRAQGPAPQLLGLI